MTPWDHVSASQIETFSLCERKWFFKSVMRLPTPEHASAALGKAVHESIERYSKGEIPPTKLHPLAVRVFERGLIPAPKSTFVEQALHGVTFAGVPVEGYIDDLDFERPRGVPMITDWKTRGDPGRYSKTDEQLATDVQMNVYAGFVLSLDPLLSACDVRHVNIGTKPPNPVSVSGPTRLDRAHVARFAAEQITPRVVRMREVALLPSPVRVTANVRACTAFGGCPFREKCNAYNAVSSIPTTPTQGATTVSTTTTKEGIMARLRNDSTPAAPAKPPENPVRPPDAPASGAKAALLARLEGAKGADVTKGTPETPAAPAKAPSAAESAASGTDRKPRGFADKLSALGYDEKQIGRMTPATMHKAIDGKIDAKTVSVSKAGELVVIERAPVMAPIAGVADPDLSDLDSCVKYALEGLGWSDAEIDNMQDEMLIFVAEKKIARGTVDLVTGDDGKISDLEEKAPAPAPSRPAEQAIAAVPALGTPAVEGLVLYVGCRPVKGAHAAIARPLSDLVATLGAAVAKDAKIEHWTLLDYNDGAKRIAALLVREPPKGVFVVDRALSATSYALEALLPFADAVITAGA